MYKALLPYYPYMKQIILRSTHLYCHSKNITKRTDPTHYLCCLHIQSHNKVVVGDMLLLLQGLQVYVQISTSTGCPKQKGISKCYSTHWAKLRGHVVMITVLINRAFIALKSSASL